MTQRAICQSLAALLILVITSGVSRADEFTWDGDCPLPIWWQQCGNPLKSNWTDDPNRPGPGDTVILDGGAGETSLGADIEILDADVPGGLRINQGNVLTLTSGTSSLAGLRLFGGGVRAQAGVTVELPLNATLAGELFGPGLFLSTGASDYSDLRLRDGGTLRNLSPATLGSGRMTLEGELVNRSELTVAGGADISGSGGRLTTFGTLRFDGSGGDLFEIAPSYVQADGSLLVEGGWVLVRSSQVQLQGGSIAVSTGAILELTTGLGGTQDRRFDGLTAMTGLGLVQVRADMRVSAPVTFELGSGDRSSGQGGLILETMLSLDFDLTNRGRLRFKNGTIVGQGGRFINEGQAYTRTGGGARLPVETLNRNTFELDGSGLEIEQPGVFRNQQSVRILQGDVNGSGQFVNENLFWVEGPTPDSPTVVGVHFSNLGKVVVDRGRLTFTGDIEQLTDAGVLTGGFWETHVDGRLSFPRLIVEIGKDAVVYMARAGSIPELASLERVRGRLSLVEPLDLVSDLTVEGEVRSGPGGSLRAPRGTLSGGSGGGPGGELGVWPGGRLESSNPFMIEDGATARGYITIDTVETVDIVFPGDKSTKVVSEPPPTLEAPLVENQGRFLPTRREAVGTLVVEGDYRQGGSGRLEVEVSEMEADRLEVRGDAELAGRLEIGRVEPDPILGMPYTVLTTTGTLAGTFDEVVSGDDVRLLYTPTSVQVVFDALVPTEIFSSSFESGDTAGWSSASP